MNYGVDAVHDRVIAEFVSFDVMRLLGGDGGWFVPPEGPDNDWYPAGTRSVNAEAPKFAVILRAAALVLIAGNSGAVPMDEMSIPPMPVAGSLFGLSATGMVSVLFCPN